MTGAWERNGKRQTQREQNVNAVVQIISLSLSLFGADYEELLYIISSSVIPRPLSCFPCVCECVCIYMFA